jgi:hypothetical protein
MRNLGLGDFMNLRDEWENQVLSLSLIYIMKIAPPGGKTHQQVHQAKQYNAIYVVK